VTQEPLSFTLPLTDDMEQLRLRMFANGATLTNPL